MHTIIHIPHSQKIIPDDVRNQFLLDEPELEQEMLAMTDHYTDELFSISSKRSHAVVFTVSRLVVDPERFTDDKQEVMSKKGMGVIYTKTSDQKQLRRDISDQERKSLLDIYYYPHHKKLSDLVQNSINCSNKALVIDAHSFPSVPLPYEFDQDHDRPDICIGTDPLHTPNNLLDKVYEFFKTQEYAVELNRPFEGTYVPSDYYQKDPRVMSIMIEVNRSLYMDEISGNKNESFNKIKNMIGSFLEVITDFEIGIQE